MNERYGRRTAALDETELRGWLTGRIPAGWFEGAPSVLVDREEITVIGVLPTLKPASDVGEAEQAAVVRGRVGGFREDTRAQRMAIADELEQRTERKVAWGVEVEGNRVMFTRLAAPVMTRLRQPERQVLDTLVASGVARSRADALAWCVELVGQHTNDWLTELRDSLSEVDRVRAAGPGE